MLLVGKVALFSATVFFVAGVLMFALAAWCVAYPIRRRANPELQIVGRIATDIGALVMIRSQKKP